MEVVCALGSLLALEEITRSRCIYGSLLWYMLDLWALMSDRQQDKEIQKHEGFEARVAEYGGGICRHILRSALSSKPDKL